jgi:putative transposase
VADRTDNGGRLRVLCLIDEYSRECLALHVARKLTAEDLIEVMERLVPSVAHPPTCAATTGVSSSLASCKSGWPSIR